MDDARLSQGELCLALITAYVTRLNLTSNDLLTDCNPSACPPRSSFGASDTHRLCTTTGGSPDGGLPPELPGGTLSLASRQARHEDPDSCRPTTRVLGSGNALALAFAVVKQFTPDSIPSPTSLDVTCETRHVSEMIYERVAAIGVHDVKKRQSGNRIAEGLDLRRQRL